jgi:hypothetical protein
MQPNERQTMFFSREELEVLEQLCSEDLDGTVHAYEETIRDRTIESAEVLTQVTFPLRRRLDIVQELQQRFRKELQ